jgi:hypothetical protein
MARCTAEDAFLGLANQGREFLQGQAQRRLALVESFVEAGEPLDIRCAEVLFTPAFEFLCPPVG